MRLNKVFEYDRYETANIIRAGKNKEYEINYEKLIYNIKYSITLEESISINFFRDLYIVIHYNGTCQIIKTDNNKDWNISFNK